MVVKMRCPCPIERNETSSVNCATKDVLRHKVSFIPYDALLVMGGVFPLANISKPLVVGIVSITAVL
jgi:hypothetical protein